jgi:hypothetical protein
MQHSQAGVAATLGTSQVDNFQLVGTAANGAAATPCANVAPSAGPPLVSTPCDYPATWAGWTVSKSGGAIQLQGRPSQREHHLNVQHDGGDGLCVGWEGSISTSAVASALTATATATLVACGSANVLAYNGTTGQISPQGDHTSCLTAVQRGEHDATAPALIVSPCGGIPNDTQQFQYVICCLALLWHAVEHVLGMRLACSLSHAVVHFSRMLPCTSLAPRLVSNAFFACSRSVLHSKLFCATFQLGVFVSCSPFWSLTFASVASQRSVSQRSDSHAC